MSIKDQLNDAVKEAMKAKDGRRRDALRMLTSAIKQLEIDSQKDSTDEQQMDILVKEAKRRRESISELEAAGRPFEDEQYELALIEEFLPKQLSADELAALIDAAIAQSGASSGKEMGKVMGILTPQVKGRADGKLVSEMVKQRLG